MRAGQTRVSNTTLCFLGIRAYHLHLRVRMPVPVNHTQNTDRRWKHLVVTA